LCISTHSLLCYIYISVLLLHFTSPVFCLNTTATTHQSHTNHQTALSLHPTQKPSHTNLPTPALLYTAYINQTQPIYTKTALHNCHHHHHLITPLHLIYQPLSNIAPLSPHIVTKLPTPVHINPKLPGYHQLPPVELPTFSTTSHRLLPPSLISAFLPFSISPLPFCLHKVPTQSNNIFSLPHSYCPNPSTNTPVPS